MGLADTELGLWAVGRPVGRREGRLVDGQQLEETGGCGWRTTGVMMGGGPVDDRGVAGFHHQSTSIGSLWPSMDGLKTGRVGGCGAGYECRSCKGYRDTAAITVDHHG